MRSKNITIELNSRTGIHPFTPERSARTITVEPNGTFEVLYLEKPKPITALSTPHSTHFSREQELETYHLDTDEGLAKFIELIKESAARDKASEIVTALFLKG